MVVANDIPDFAAASNFDCEHCSKEAQVFVGYNRKDKKEKALCLDCANLWFGDLDYYGDLRGRYMATGSYDYKPPKVRLDGKKSCEKVRQKKGRPKGGFGDGPAQRDGHR